MDYATCKGLKFCNLPDVLIVYFTFSLVELRSVATIASAWLVWPTCFCVVPLINWWFLSVINKGLLCGYFPYCLWVTLFYDMRYAFFLYIQHSLKVLKWCDFSLSWICWWKATLVNEPGLFLDSMNYFSEGFRKCLFSSSDLSLFCVMEESDLIFKKFFRIGTAWLRKDWWR